MCKKRWTLYLSMSRSYYSGSNVLRRSVYKRKLDEYMNHLMYCQECRLLLEADASGPDHPAGLDERLEAWAHERGVL